MIKILNQVAFDFRVKAGYTIAFVLLLICYVLTLYENNQLLKQMEWVNHTNKTINDLEKLISGMKDAETGLRGYVNTKDTSFLEPYKSSFSLVDSTFDMLKEDTKSNETQQSHLLTLNSLIRDGFTRLEFAVKYFPQNNYVTDDSLLHSFYIGKIKMDRIRAEVREMQNLESNILNTRTENLNGKYKAVNIITITSFILALIFALFGFYTYRREYKARLLADGKVNGYQKELQQRIVELDKANKELLLMKRSEKFAATGRIARTIAHEVRNPLTNINLAVSQLKNDLADQDENSTMLFDMVERNSKRINQLISELLSATRFAELVFVSVSVNTLLDEALELAKDRIELKQITVQKNYAPNIRNISVDAEKVRIAFLNLIVNAIEAMEPITGILKIHTEENDNKCIIEISDNGSGMTEEQLNNLFEPYFTTKANGNGLGLTNTHNVILNHRGVINVTSLPATGTTFTIKFNFTN